MKDGVSIIIPAYNEEKNVGNAISSVLRACKSTHIDYEVIAVDDGSNDGTFRIVSDYAKKNKKIKVIKHDVNKGIGMSIRDGITYAHKPFIGGFPGDNDMSWKSLAELIRLRKKADAILSYMANPAARSIRRRIISKIFVLFVNALFGLHLRYFNGYFIVKADLVKSLHLKSSGFTIFSEILIRLMKRQCTYKEIPFYHIPRIYGKSKAISIKSVRLTLGVLYHLFFDLRSGV